VKELLDHYITAYGIRYIRYDFNIDPLPYWDAHDEQGRAGITQLRHVQGLYAIIDWVRDRHPGTVLECCASGGRRIDLETVRRFHTAWISDHTADSAVVRYHLFGINHFLPGSYHYVAYVLPLSHQKDFEPRDIDFQSLFAGAFGMGGRIDLWPEAMKNKARLHVRMWKRLRRYLLEDYYPLSAQPGDLQCWSGWQFHDPQDQSGFAQTFRTRTPDGAHRFVLRGLDENARYRFTDAYSGETFDMTGRVAMTDGIEVMQEPMSSTVLTYERSL
jgi:alpha-galactosidase